MNILYILIAGFAAMAVAKNLQNKATATNTNTNTDTSGSGLNADGGVAESNFSNGIVDALGAKKPDRFAMGDTWTIPFGTETVQVPNPDYKKLLAKTYGQKTISKTQPAYKYLRRGVIAKNKDGVNSGAGAQIFALSGTGSNQGYNAFFNNYNDSDWDTEGKVLHDGDGTANDSWSSYVQNLANSQWGQDLAALQKLDSWKKSGGFQIFDKQGDDPDHPYDSNCVGMIISDGKTAGLLIPGLTGTFGTVNPFDMTVTYNGANVGDVNKFALQQYLKYNLGQYVRVQGSGLKQLQKAVALVNKNVIISPNASTNKTDPKNYGLPVGNSNANQTTGIDSSTGANASAGGGTASGMLKKN